jgi:hypothetical protein
MSLGASLWKTNEVFYEGLTLAQDGIGPEQDFAARPRLAALFPRYEVFWRRHVCPATTRPHGVDFRPGISDIVCTIAMRSFSIMGKLLDADDSLSKVMAGDLGERCRNWRDAIEAAGNALQLNTELRYVIAGPHLPSLAGILGVTLNPFPDWKTNWSAEREMATKYRHYLVHEGLVYTVTTQPAGETLVLGRQAFASGVNWNTASASYDKRPQDWQSLQSVCAEVVVDTVASIDLTYERLIDRMEPLLTSAAYQQLWGWNHGTVPTSPVIRPSPATIAEGVTIHATSAAKTVISSGPSISS